jgi:ribonuclease HI
MRMPFYLFVSIAASMCCLCQQIFEPNHDIVEEEIAGPTSPKKVQKEWSCAVCLFSTSSEIFLKKHFQGKEHETNEENLRAEELARDTSKSLLTAKREPRMVFLGNLANLETWSDLLGPVARSIRWCQWKRPDFGWIKLNTDGSIDSENAGIGGLFRDYEGNAICGFVSKASGHDIFLVELWAIWRGLVLALNLHIQVLWVESDSLSVVNTINRQQPYSGKADACLKQIRLLLKKFKKHKVSHSWRETNRAADYLAKMVVERDVVLWPADFPTSLNNIIKDDAEGMVYCRR